ncbi:MAG: shikimate kinase [Clostridiales bacterium]|nr:shikimate kinase [Clostridiales bacterium]
MPSKEYQNLVLCGFMGCGKTTVGRSLAALTGRPLIDMDEYIVQQAGQSVAAIFEAEGEEGFRRRERQACQELAALSGRIIAAGGGALTFEENVQVLAATGVIVLLDIPLEVSLRRLKQDTSRPLLAGPGREQRARELYAIRLPLYRAAAGLTVEADAAPDEVARRILLLEETAVRGKAGKSG